MNNAPNILIKKVVFLTPHSILFIGFNLFYLIPIVLASLLNYSEGGVGYVLNNYKGVFQQFIIIYLISIVSFVIGSSWTGWLKFSNKISYWNIPKYKLGILYYITLITVILLFILSKYLLIEKGVYDSYAFNAKTMVGGIWTFSAFLSEVLVLLLIATLFSNNKRKWILVTFIGMLVSINLLHGTRIFIFVIFIALLVYMLLSSKITFKRFLWFIFLIISLFFLLFAVFMFRHEMKYSVEATSLEIMFSPIIYETVFSQMSLMGLLSDGNFSPYGSIQYFFTDIIQFTIPRFIFPNKGEFLYIRTYSYLSPLGAFSGYASGLIYFGYFFWLFYFFLGSLLSWILEISKKSSFFSIIYLYLVSDILFRIMRDGYVIPGKMVITAFIILLGITFGDKLIKGIIR